MTDTTQTLRDVLARGRRYEGELALTGEDWDALSDECGPDAMAALLARLDAAEVGIKAATLAERERCAALVEALTARRRWIRMACNSQKTIEPCELAAAIRDGVKP